MIKVARLALQRGHVVKIFTLRWQAPPMPEFEVVELPIVGMNRHTQYENFALAFNQAVQAEHFDLVVGFNKMPGLDVYYAGDSCFVEKAHTQRSAGYRLLPRYKSFHAAEQAVYGAGSPTQVLTISDNEVPRYRHY